ncbi:MAG TPA: hypothetical protein VFX25_39755 [Streptosporangiaceae bacterium]|nr:hypothetical protein [Streptosporangiaceae bacterium]
MHTEATQAQPGATSAIRAGRCPRWTSPQVPRSPRRPQPPPGWPSRPAPGPASRSACRAGSRSTFSPTAWPSLPSSARPSWRALGPEPYAGAEALAPDPARGSAVAGFVASFPGGAHPEPQVTRTRAELDARVARVRSEGFSRDAGRIHPSIHCVARPWPAAGLPSAIACVGSQAEITLRRSLIEACLTAATEPAATSPDIIRAAASAA